MNTKKVASEYRLSQWAQVIQTRLHSGQSIKNFCQAAGISRNGYFYWQKKLREAACTELENTGLADKFTYTIDRAYEVGSDIGLSDEEFRVKISNAFEEWLGRKKPDII